jgi:hypothetical protein
MEMYCKGLQLKPAAKGCQLLMSHIVENCDYVGVLDIAEVLGPAWFKSKKHGDLRKKTIAERVLKDLMTSERRCLRETKGNRTYNLERKRG